MQRIAWWTFGGIAFMVVILLVFLGTRGGTWRNASDGIQTVTIPQSWTRQKAPPGVVWFVSPQNKETCLWLVSATHAPFYPGAHAQRLPSPQLNIVEWQVSTAQSGTHVMNLYGIYRHDRRYRAIHIEVPKNQLALGSQILGSWQPIS